MRSTPKSILVPTDFSTTAEHAFSLACRLARRFGARIHVLHVRVLLDEPHLDEEHLQEVRRLLSRGDEASRRVLENANDCQPEAGFETHLVSGVSAAETIVRTCAKHGCDLVVMGTNGRRGLKHLLLGSVTEEVVRTAPVPVLTVRQNTAIDSPEVRRILLPHDFSDHSAAALELASSWAAALGASITLFHAVEPVVYPEFYAVDLLPSEMIDRLEARSRQALDELAAELDSGVEVRTLVASGRAAEAVNAAASAQSADLVIMGTRGLSALEHLLLGSVAENVVRSCTAPVLTVRRP